MKTAAVVLGLVLAAFVVPAESLSGFFPGFEAGSNRNHVKYGVVPAAAAVVLFGIGWRAGRR